jgi:hypothetical protein
MFHKSTSFGFSAKAFTADKLKQRKSNSDNEIRDLTGMKTAVSVDTSWWLPKAAEVYNISPRLEDYIIVPVIAFISDLPNTNGDCFSKKEMLRFNPEYGMLSFQTFKGKPTHIHHQNQDHTKAKGVIFDVEASLLKGYAGNHMKVVLLSGFDRTRDPILCNQILTGEINTYSMGAYYDAYECSVCGHKVGKGYSQIPCAHTELRRPTYKQADGQLVFRKCINNIGFENSAVTSPAFLSAVSDIIL